MARRMDGRQRLRTVVGVAVICLSSGLTIRFTNPIFKLSPTLSLLHLRRECVAAD